MEDWINNPRTPVNDKTTWCKFVEMMHTRFLPLDHLNNICKALLNVTQNGSVSQYNNLFEDLVSQLDSATRNNELFLVNTYINGLQTAVRESIQYLLLPTLRENMTRAALYDSTHPSKRNGNSQPFAVNAFHQFSRKNRQNANGHSNNYGNGNGDKRNKNGPKGQSSSQKQSVNNVNPARHTPITYACDVIVCGMVKRMVN